MYSTVYIEMMGDLIGQYVNLFTSKKDRKSTLIVKNSVYIINSIFLFMFKKNKKTFIFSFFKTSLIYLLSIFVVS